MAVYEGNENYIFISYAHRDGRMAMKVVKELMDRGYRVWYDEGITPGSEWPENIAQHLDRSAAVIAFVTPHAMASDNCRREIHFALSRKKPFLSVFLEKTELPLGMELQLAAQQSVLQYNFRTEQEFIEKICSCEHLQPCLMPKEIPVPPSPQKKPQAAMKAVPDSAPQPKPETIPEPASLQGKKWLVFSCAFLVAASALGFVIGGKRPSAESKAAELPTIAAAEVPAETTAETTEEPAASETEESVAPPEPLQLAFMRNPEHFTSDNLWSNGAKEYAFWGQEDYLREQVETVQFQSTLEGVPASAWDVSAAADRSVLAWMDGAALHVAANNRITIFDASYMFYDFVNLKSIDWGNCFDTSIVGNMKRMFTHCEALTSLDLSGFDTSAVTDMSGMFTFCDALTSLDVSNFDTSAVTDMSGMFTFCDALTSLDISGFDTSAVTDMSGMFLGCISLTVLDVSHFDTSAVTDMSDMFSYCNALTSLDLSHFDTSAVTHMKYMFENCIALTDLDVSGFDISAVTDMEDMFKSCTKLPKSSIPQWYTGKK